MGANQAKTLGVQPGKKVDTKLRDKLWKEYCKGKDGLMIHQEACKFLQDFSVAVRVAVDEEAIEMIVAEVHPDRFGCLDKNQFGQLIADAAVQKELHNKRKKPSLSDSFAAQVTRDAAAMDDLGSDHKSGKKHKAKHVAANA